MSTAAEWKRWIINLGLMAGSVLICFIFLEIGLRIFETVKRHPSAEILKGKRDNEWVFFEYDSIRGWKNKAGTKGIFTIPDSKTLVKINSKGLRDIEHCYEKPRRFRILTLGDSFTWGFGVEQHERYTERLNELLGERIEIINAGVSGYGTDQELLYFIHEGFKYQPDLVILEFGTEDIINNRNSIQYTYPKPYFIFKDNKLALMNVPVPKRNAKWEERFDLIEAQSSRISDPSESEDGLSSLSKLKSFFRRNLKSYPFVVDRVKSLVKSKKAHYEFDDLTNTLLLELKNMVQAHQSKFLVVLIPYKNAILRHDENVYWEGMLQFLAQNNFAFLDLRPLYLKEETEEKPLYFAVDPHWNPHGHRLAAQAVCEYLFQNGVIPSHTLQPPQCHHPKGI